MALIVWSWVMNLSRPDVQAARRTTLTWTSDDNPLRKEQISLFNRKSRSCWLRLDPDNQSMDKVIVQSMAGVGPDIFDCRNADQLSAYVRSGIAWDVTDLLREKGIDVRRDTWPALDSLSVFEGRVYAVPTNIAPNALWIHRDLFRKAGIGIPRTPWNWDEFIETAKKLTNADGSARSQFGFMFDWWNWPHFVLGFGGSVFNRNGTVCTVDSPECVAAIQLMHDLVYRYRVSPSPVEEAGMASKGGWGSGTMNLFGAKRAAMALGGRWWYVNLRQFDGLELGVLESPYQTKRTFLAIARASCINRRSTRRDAALEFLFYLSSPEYARLIDEQADGSPAFRKYSQNRSQNRIEDPDSQVWLDIAGRSETLQTSPYVDGSVVNRLINTQIDLVRIDAKPAAQAMRDAARAVNEAIRENLQNDPQLKARWISEGGDK